MVHHDIVVKNSSAFTEEDFPQLMHQNNSSKQSGGRKEGRCGWRQAQKLISTGGSRSPKGSVSLKTGGGEDLGFGRTTLEGTSGRGVGLE